MIPTLALGQFGRAGHAAAAGGSPALDALTTDLWSAHGITKLLTSYAGSAIRVRRSSDNTEQDIGFSGIYLNTATLSAFVGANDAFITKLYDQSGGGHDLVQATNSKQPRIVSAGVYDGLVRFDGAAHYMTIASGPAVAAISLGFKYQIRSGGATQNYVALNNTFTAAHNAFAIQEQTDGSDSIRAYMFTGTQNPFVQNNFAVTTGSDGVDLWVCDRAASGTARMARYRNGSAQSPISSPQTSTSAGNWTSETIFVGADSSGAAAFSTMNLYTLAIWNTTQAANQAAIAAALA